MDKSQISEYGIDYDRGLLNCAGDESFYKAILEMFLEDRCFEYGKSAFLANDITELFNRMHELKGISGNTALMKLFGCVVPLVDALRSENVVIDDEIRRLFEQTENAYNLACEGIRKITEQ